MASADTAGATRLQRVAHVLFLLGGAGFVAYLLRYYLTTEGGSTLLAFTLVPVTYILFTLNALRKGTYYPRLGEVWQGLLAAITIGVAATVSIYMTVEFEDLGTVRAGDWNTTDLILGGAMVILVMEFARQRYFVLFVINIVLILYAVYGWVVPGMFYHPGLSWTRIVTTTSVEDSTGVFSSLPQLALTLIGSFVLVLAVLRAFGTIDSILKATRKVAVRSPLALPQAAVAGSMGVAAVSGSGAANAVTTGSATIPALIRAGMKRADAAAVETASSLGGQLMPPIMGISAFLMADFLGRSYFDVVVRGYIPALIYFLAVATSVYLVSHRTDLARPKAGDADDPGPLEAADWFNFGAFATVVVGLVVLMVALHTPPMFAALDIFAVVGGGLFLASTVREFRARGIAGLRRLREPVLRFIDHFTTMTSDLTLLLAVLAILAAVLVNTGVPTKIGFLLIDAAAISVLALAVVAFLFGAVLGMGLPPAPTYILTALVIAPHLIQAGIDPWPVHFFAFFLAVWGELTPPTSVVAAITSRIADGPFLATLWRALLLCSPLFVLMAAMFTRPELVLEPGSAQLEAMGFVLVAAVGVAFSLQARFHRSQPLDTAIRAVVGLAALVALCHPEPTAALAAGALVIASIVYWWRYRPVAAHPSG